MIATVVVHWLRMCLRRNPFPMYTVTCSIRVSVNDHSYLVMPYVL